GRILYADAAAPTMLVPPRRVGESAQDPPESVHEWLEAAERDLRHCEDLWALASDLRKTHDGTVGCSSRSSKADARAHRPAENASRIWMCLVWPRWRLRTSDEARDHPALSGGTQPRR